MKYLILLLITTSSFAADYSIRFGPSINREGKTDGSSKIFGLRREELLLDGIHSGLEVGGYVDNGGEGRSSAGLVKLQLGIRPTTTSGFYGYAFVGPAAISKTDSILGSIPQFATDFGVGIADKETIIFVGYSHISNAGIFSRVNKGRDFLIFSAAVRF